MSDANGTRRFLGHAAVAGVGVLTSLFAGGAAGVVGAGVAAAAGAKYVAGQLATNSLRYTGTRTIDNLFTGFEPTTIGKAGLFGGFALLTGNSIYQGYQEQYDQMGIDNGGDMGVQSLPSTRADMMGYNRMVPTNAMDLGATGDLVFALHKLRGGY